jgi:hypothetical protein
VGVCCGIRACKLLIHSVGLLCSAAIRIGPTPDYTCHLTPTWRAAPCLCSYALNCKRALNPSRSADVLASHPTIMQCTDQAGCTACKPGQFRTPNPLVPNTAMCMPCDGCPNSQCGANGCASCPNAVLNKRVTHPWGVTGMNGQPVMVCRNAAGATTPFKSRTGLVSNSVWPSPEFANCPKGARRLPVFYTACANALLFAPCPATTAGRDNSAPVDGNAQQGLASQLHCSCVD